jgi:threonine dehydratase
MTSEPTGPSLPSPTFDDLCSARELLRGHAVVTPVLESPELSALVGGRLVFKAESLQRTGSYKFRGAYNRLARLSAEEKRRGIVAFSTGNFGQAVACAARLLGIPATIIVPQDAPAVKIQNCRGYGATVLFYERANKTQREEMARELAGRKGLTIVPPGDDRFVIAGYGTSGMELLDQFQEPLDALLCPCGGGGLSAGIALAFAERQPATKIFTVEPAGFDDTARSLATGERVGIEPGHTSICDAILTPIPAELPFRTLRERVPRGLVVDDAATLRAMGLAFKHLKLVLEPAGAIALAAALSGQYDCRGQSVAILCSGASVDPAVYARALATLNSSP